MTVFKQVEIERKRQDQLWGEQNHKPEVWLSILAEEVGEVAQEVQNMKFKRADGADYREELVQVAAVAVAMIEAFDRSPKGKKKPKRGGTL